uniref:hypothetical protein n=1 Tax=Salmonella sp. TaxID=599 RepID=UPI003996C5FB
MAYVDELTPEQIAIPQHPDAPGKTARTATAALKRSGVVRKNACRWFEEGKACLRAKIDMASPFIRDARPGAVPY